MNFSVWDIEVVNDSATSIATIGIVGVDNGVVVETAEFHIKPEPFEFNKRMTDVNGLIEKDFINAPTFPEVWNELSELLLKYDFCVAHNASFDFGIIRDCCNEYKLNCRNFPVLDSLAYSRNSNLDVSNHKLDTLCRYFNINLDNHHNALCDALATAEIMLKLIELNEDNILDVFRNGNIRLATEYKARHTVGIQKTNKLSYNHNWGLHAKDVEAADIKFDKNNAFYGKKVVISGELNSMGRRQAYSILKACGAEPCDNITLSTNFLVTNAETKTGKIKKALAYIAQGKEIKIINEKTFLELIGVE